MCSETIIDIPYNFHLFHNAQAINKTIYPSFENGFYHGTLAQAG